MFLFIIGTIFSSQGWMCSLGCISASISFVFLAFLWCRSLAVFAESSLQSDFNGCYTSSFLLAPSWSSLSLTHTHTQLPCPVLPKQAPNEAKPPHSLRHGHVAQRLPSICQRVLHVSISPSQPHSVSCSFCFLPLPPGRQVWIRLRVQTLWKSRTTQITSIGGTDGMDAVALNRKPLACA